LRRRFINRLALSSEVTFFVRRDYRTSHASAKVEERVRRGGVPSSVVASRSASVTLASVLEIALGAGVVANTLGLAIWTWWTYLDGPR